MRIVRYVLNLVLVCGVVWLIVLQSKTHQSDEKCSMSSNPPEITINDDIRSFFPQAATLSYIPNIWTEIYDAENQNLGYILYTAPYADDIYGFAGNTPLIIALDGNQKIQGTKILANNESTNYLEYVTNEGLFDSWNELSIRDAMNKQVDAISGATYTSESVINSLKTRLSILDNTNYLFKKNDPWVIVKRFFSSLVIIFAVFCFFYPKKTKAYRLYLLGISVIVLGFWQASFLSLAQIHASLTTDVPFFAQCIFVVILILSILLPFITGKQFYCQYLCPFGASQELIGKLSKRKVSISTKITKALIFMRKMILLCIIFLLITNITSDLSLIEPFSAFNIRSASTYTLIFAGLFLALSAFVRKPWCRFFCPTGQLLDTFKAISFRKAGNEQIANG